MSFRHVLIFVHQIDPLSGIDSISAYQMYLDYDETEQRLEARAKRAVSTSFDISGRSGVGIVYSRFRSLGRKEPPLRCTLTP